MLKAIIILFTRYSRATELEIATLICKELSYKEIAEELTISLRTVESHKTNILEKIGASKVTGLVVYATKKGWI